MRWGEMTREEIEVAAGRNAQVVVPLGCTEQHAFHLPVDTDTYQVERATVEAARLAGEGGLDVIVLPPLPFGPASEHFGMAGTISLSNDIYIPVVKQIVWSVIDSGFRRIVVVTGCGGHWAVPGALWDLKAEAHRAGIDLTLRVIGVSDEWGPISEDIYPGGDGGHAAVMETALCLAEREHLVRRERMVAPATNQLMERYREGGEVFLFDEMTSTGALGDPSPATVEGGREAWERIISGLARRFAFFEEQDRELGRFAT
ncbi:mycofactocin biosynthesis peptidyl-dipeptidase MftE [soil metagenome]